MDKLTFKHLSESGGMVSRKPVEKVIKWRGEEYIISVRILGAGQAEEIFQADPEKKSRQARLISGAVLLGSGDDQTPLTYDQAYNLDPILSKAMVDAVNEAQDVGNPSAPVTSSGTT